MVVVTGALVVVVAAVAPAAPEVAAPAEVGAAVVESVVPDSDCSADLDGFSSTTMRPLESSFGSNVVVVEMGPGESVVEVGLLVVVVVNTDSTGPFVVTCCVCGAPVVVVRLDSMGVVCPLAAPKPPCSFIIIIRTRTSIGTVIAVSLSRAPLLVSSGPSLAPVATLPVATD